MEVERVYRELRKRDKRYEVDKKEKQTDREWWRANIKNERESR
jgi:hypothetical protein